MSAHPPPADQFWLLTGEVPGGPLTAHQIHVELAAGRATRLAPASPVGRSDPRHPRDSRPAKW
jgi:hypothetical protein